MAATTSSAPPRSGMRASTPRQRITAVADGGVVAFLDAPRPSPHLARFGVTAADDDGVVTAAVAIEGARVLIAAQDERFLRGSVGAHHADALRALFQRALTERPVAVVLLLASGGVRLHEANAAELALARALRALFAARAAGIAVVGLAIGDVFGGASILACAAERLGLLSDARIGLSGPKVIETARGVQELDATDDVQIDAVFAARARVAAGDGDLVADEPAALRAWIRAAAAASMPFAAHLRETHAALAARVVHIAAAAPVSDFRAQLHRASALDSAGWLWRSGDALFTRPFTGVPFAAPAVHRLDTALLGDLPHAANGTPVDVVVTEDSTGHEISRGAEARFESRFLAHHAAVLAHLVHRGHRVTGLLTGVGHSAAFFVNALQAPRLLALPGARVVAMEPAAVARVTGLDVASLAEDDLLLGQPVRHLAALGGVDAIVAPEDVEQALAQRQPT